MRQFMDENFLLNNKTAEELFHRYANKMPIYDYHCHLNPEEIAVNKKYNNITEAWLQGDHYKWRAMRSAGIDERYITGDADDYEKFMAWSKTIPLCLGNPLYHWTHLELRRYFGVYEVLHEKTADDIWHKCNTLLTQDDFAVQELIKKSNVKLICTTDDPTDHLKHHRQLAGAGNFGVKVLPTFRPDKGLNIEKPDFLPYLHKLSGVSGIEIKGYASFLQALESRIDYFHQAGCRISDHALDRVFFRKANREEVEGIFRKGLQQEKLTGEEIEKHKTATLIHLGRAYHERGWAMQLHIGAQRNNNTKAFQILGPDTGFDSISDESIAAPLSRLLDALEQEGKLPKTILYSVNPKDNYTLASMLGNFQGGGIAGKLQFGSGWWFNDQKEGMRAQMTDLANLGLLSRFIGMLTDSRSFLSYTRHEYFRRILCNLLGRWTEDGEVPYDMELLGRMVEDICYNNARNYFNIEL